MCRMCRGGRGLIGRGGRVGLVVVGKDWVLCWGVTPMRANLATAEVT